MFSSIRGAPLHIRLLQVMVGGVAAILILALWVAAVVTTGIDREFALRQARTQVASIALNLEEGIHRHFVLIDQALRILQLDWERDPAAFSLSALRRRAGSLAPILSEVMIVDAQGRVVDGTRRELIGTDLSGRRFMESHRHADTDNAVIEGPLRNFPNGAWYMTVSRRVNTPEGKFAGVVVSAYDLSALTHEMAAAETGRQGLVMLVGRDGIVRALYEHGEREPGDDISNTPFFQAAFNAPGGTWIGPSPTDPIERIHGFRAVPDHDMVLVVGVDQAAALANVDARRRQAILAASAITVLLILIAFGLSLNIGAAHRREMRLAHDRMVLAAANQQLQTARDQASAKSLELETTFAGMTDGISIFDRNLNLISWNHRFPELTGIPPGILVFGLPLATVLRAQAEAGEFGPKPVDQEVAGRISMFLARKNMGVIERFRPDGRVLELRRTALPDGGFVTLYTDITARKLAEAAQKRAREAAEQAAEEKSRFLAIVSHEIRTPLNVAVNTFRLLDQSDLAPPQRTLVANGLHAGEALLGLLNDILDLSRMEVGRLALRPAPFALRPMLDGVVEMFKPASADRRIVLTLDIGPGVPDRVLTDAGRLRQILMNLLSNMAKFAEPGPAQVRACVQLGADRRLLRLAVRDSGPSIPDPDRAKLFRPFSQLERQGGNPNGSPSGSAIGTGLGLSICQLLAHLLDGEIGCDPIPGGGKEFWLTLPLDRIEVRPEDEPVRGSVTTLRIPHSRVLVVEDVAANQMIVATLLRREGHTVDLASDGEEALAIVANRAYDLVFMDIFMPGMDGVETMKRIRTMDGYPGHVPIVALTANVSDANRAEYLHSGFQDVLGKPVDRTALLTALSRYVWNRRPASPLERPPSVRPAIATAGVAAGAAADATASATAANAASAVVPLPEPVHPVLDTARLSELQGGLPAGLFAGLIESALEDLRERVPPLREAALGNRKDEVKTIAHAMAGVAGSYGLVALEVMLRQLMTGARSPDAATLDGPGGLTERLGQAEEALHSMLQVQAA